MSALRHELTPDDRVFISLGPGKHGHFSADQARRFAWGILADFDDITMPQDTGAALQIVAMKKALGMVQHKAPIRMLRFLMARRGRLVTKPEMAEAVGTRAQSFKVLDVQMCRLRAVLRPLGADVDTVYGEGWTMSPEHAQRMDRALAEALAT